MSNISYFTEGGLKKLKDELQHLISVERPSISKQIAEARDKGDLSENAEYDAAKEAQGLLEMRIAKMEDVVKNARVMDDSALDLSKVHVLSKVKIKNLNNNATMSYTLVAEQEANIKENKISVDSPIGKGLMGKKKGEVAEITVPAGKIKFKIEEIVNRYITIYGLDQFTTSNLPDYHDILFKPAGKHYDKFTNYSSDIKDLKPLLKT